MAQAGETIDSLFGGRVTLIQRTRGYRFTSDAVILAHASLTARGRIIDLGTGCGILPVIIATFGAAAEVVGIEIQAELAAVAKRNVVRNHLEERVRIVRGDLRRVKDHFKAQSFNQVIANPPYLAVDAGRINPNRERAVARHEILCRIEDLVAAAKYLLRDRGIFRLIFPNTRLVDLALLLRQTGLEPKRLQFVHDQADGPSKVALVEATKNARAQAEIGPPIILRDAAGSPTDDYRRIFGVPDPGLDIFEPV